MLMKNKTSESSFPQLEYAVIWPSLETGAPGIHVKSISALPACI